MGECEVEAARRRGGRVPGAKALIILGQGISGLKPGSISRAGAGAGAGAGAKGLERAEAGVRVAEWPGVKSLSDAEAASAAEESRQERRRNRVVILLMAVGVYLLILATAAVEAHAVQTGGEHKARVKDIASIEGIRDNQLVGYGLVVGLQGTGDSQQTTFPTQTLAAMLLRMGVSVPATAIRVQNLAAVFVSATLPPFARPGTKLDITASSAGDARSLEGGLLLMTPLYGTDGKIYAQAQGPLVVGGYTVTSNGNTKQLNHPNVGRIPFGAMVEKGIGLDITGRDRFSILLNDADFKGAGALAEAINQELGRPAARAYDSRRVDLYVKGGEDVPELLARVEGVEVMVFPRAKVVVNERTGTVVIGGTVVLQPVSILHGGLSVNVVTDFVVSQPGALSGGSTQTVPVTRVAAQDKPVSRIELKQGATVDDLVRSLQTTGATARDVISILQAMKSAGALEAEIEVL